MKHKLEKIISFITGSDKSNKSPSILHIQDQFYTGEEDSAGIARNLNAAFLIALSGDTHPHYTEALNYLNRFESDPLWEQNVQFYIEGITLIHAEILNRCNDDEHFKGNFSSLYDWLTNPENIKKKQPTVETMREFFFPEGVGLCEDREGRIKKLRDKRKISITRLNPAPISDPAKELLFTSNILLTIPPASKDIDDLSVSSSIKHTLKQTVEEDQRYWYDHPIPIGIAPEHNEVLYGLEGLDEAVEIEKKRGVIGWDSRVTCILSVSVTHEGLQKIAKEYLEDEFRKEKNIRHLDVYILTEADTARLIGDILIPASEKYSDQQNNHGLYETIGVDGEYGRHYSFLKAIAAFWQVLVNNRIKG
ncbi:MAG: hypothetical protein JSU99_06230, partial [Nitrospiraceae bacterium]